MRLALLCGVSASTLMLASSPARAQTCGLSVGSSLQLSGPVPADGGLVVGPDCAHAQAPPPPPPSPPVFSLSPYRSVDQFCSASEAASDATTCTQVALDTIRTAGTGTLLFGVGPYNYTSCPASGTSLAITDSGVALAGVSRQTVLQFSNGACDDLRVGYQSGQIANVSVRDVYLNHSGKTGGAALNANNVAFLLVDNVSVDHPWSGIYLRRTNTVDLRAINVNMPTGPFGLKAYAAPGERSDLIQFHNVSVACGYNPGTDGFLFDNAVYTTRMFGTAGLNCRYNYRFTNSARSTTDYPAFVYAFDLESDGATVGGVSIEAGSNYYITASDISNTSGGAGQGSTDGPALQILPDLGASVTHSVTITGGRVGNSQRQAAYVEARDVTISGTLFTDASKAGVGLYPAVEIGPSAVSVQISGAAAGALYGMTLRTNYGVQVDAGATDVQIVGGSYKSNVLGPLNLLNGGATTVMMPGLVQGPTGANSSVHAGAGQTLVLGAAGSTDIYIDAAPSLKTAADGVVALGAPGQRWSNVSGVTLQTGATTVGALPACNAGAIGKRYFVTDASSATYHAVAAGGGTGRMGVTCDGANWYLN